MYSGPRRVSRSNAFQLLGTRRFGSRAATRCVFIPVVGRKIGDEKEKTKILSPSLFSRSRGKRGRAGKKEEEEEVKILATLEAFSFDAHRIPGRLESLRFP